MADRARRPIHQTVALVCGPAEADEIEILRHAAWLEPEGDCRAADEQPFAVESIGDRLHDGLESRPVELQSHDARVIPVSPSWKLLAEAGVPIGAVRRAPKRLPHALALRAALEAAWVELPAVDDDTAPLLAWLAAFHHHWPARFDEVLGARGKVVLRALRARSHDANRYLKLRRIAIDNLSRSI